MCSGAFQPSALESEKNSETQLVLEEKRRYDMPQQPQKFQPSARDLVDSLGKAGRLSAIAQFVLLAVAAGLCARGNSALLVMAVLIVIANCVRLWLSVASVKESLSDETWLHVYRPATLASGFLWGCFSAIAVVSNGLNSDHATLCLDIAAGISAASLSSLASDRILSKSFVAAVLVPITLALLFHPDATHIAIASVTAFYALFLMSQLQSQCDSLWLLKEKVVRERSALAQHERLVNEVSQAKASFFAHVSHEIRTPLNGIIGMTELLQAEPDSKDRDGQLQMLSSASLYLLELINNFLDFSKANAGQMQLNQEIIGLETMILKTLDLSMNMANKKSLKVEVSCSRDVPERVKIDSLRVSQVLINLVSNAIKFTESGTVRVEVGAGFHRGRATLNFAVSDSGIGIDTEQAKGLFEPFAQASASTTRKFGGTGLGLALCKKLVELMNGDISFTSAIGKGSTFRFAIPFEPVALSSRPVSVGTEKNASTSMPRDLAGVRILVAEDNPTNQAVISAMLRKAGASFVMTENGAAAFEKNQLEVFDLILMDCMMPVCDGYEATRRIRDDELKTGKRAVKIVALTASADDDVRRRCRACGINDVLSKPIRLRDLIEAVKIYSRAG